MTDQDQSYHIERLTADNLPDVVRLHAIVYGQTPHHFEKKYDTAYTGRQYVGFIAYNAGRIPVGYYGVIPCFLQNGESLVLSAQSADTMTHPGYRYKGLFVELSNKCFDLCREEGIRIIFGFPNQNSYHGAINKLGWKMTETMDSFSIRVKTIPLESISHRLSFLKPVYRRYRDARLKKYLAAKETVPNSVLADGYCGVWRGEEYLSYKTYHDHLVIRINGSLLWIKAGTGLVMGDMMTSGNFEETIRGIRQLAMRLGVREAIFQVSTGTSLHAIFRGRFAATPSFPVLFQDFNSGLLPERIKFTFADIDIF